MDEEHNRVEFWDKTTETAYLALEDKDPQLFRHISRSIEDLQNNRRAGRPAPKWFIPPKYRKVGVDNIWRYNMPGAWRLLYTITGNHIRILIIVLNWMTHKEYERMIGLRGRKGR